MWIMLTFSRVCFQWKCPYWLTQIFFHFLLLLLDLSVLKLLFGLNLAGFLFREVDYVDYSSFCCFFSTVKITSLFVHFWMCRNKNTSCFKVSINLHLWRLLPPWNHKSEYLILCFVTFHCSVQNGFLCKYIRKSLYTSCFTFDHLYDIYVCKHVRHKCSNLQPFQILLAIKTYLEATCHFVGEINQGYFTDFHGIDVWFHNKHLLIHISGATVLYGIDATNLHQCPSLVTEGEFDCVIFQFPHVGGKASIKKNRQLLKEFFMRWVSWVFVFHSVG